MAFIVLLVLALVSQVILVSCYLPRRIANAAREPVRAYLSLNNGIAAIGVLFVVFCLVLDSNDVTTGLLLCIGVFFLVQVSTIAIPFWRGVLPVQRLALSEQLHQESGQESKKLFRIISPVAVSIAVSLYVLYVMTTCIQAGGLDGNQVPKLASLTITNLLFASVILWTFAKLKRESSPEKASERYKELSRMAPPIVFGSMLVTLYFFVKELMFSFDLHELRPTMMSVFLQMVAVAVFHAVWHVDSDNKAIRTVA